jgi:hypothetical protein
MTAKRRKQTPKTSEKAAAKSSSQPVAEEGRRVFWVYLGVIVIAAMVFFGSFVVDQGAMLFGTDMVSQAYQSRAFAVQEVTAGRGLPHWNPFVFAGLPYLSILPYPVYYPTSLLYFVIPLHRAIGWAFLLHFALAGLLGYALAREFRLSRGAAMVTGVAYMFTGYVVSHLYAGQDGRMFAMQWTPALFLFAERAIRRRRAHWFLWMAGVAALQVFTPHVQMMYFAAMAVSGYVVFRLVGVYVGTGDAKTVGRLLAAFVGAYALAGLVALVQILPTLGMLQYSHRADRGYAYASSWAMPVQESIAMVWPNFQGYLQSYWGSNPFKLHTEYLGAIPVLLAIVALVARRSARIWFFAFLALVGLFFAWGGATPVHRVFYWTLPVMKSFRAPAMMYSIVTLSVVILAGHGAQALYDRREEISRKGHLLWKVIGGLGGVWLILWLWAASSPDGFATTWSGWLYGPMEPSRAATMRSAMGGFVGGFGLFVVYWIVGVTVCWAAARGRIRPLIACALLAGLSLVDLWRVDRSFYDTLPVAQLTTPDPAVRFLQNEPQPHRVFPLNSAYGPNDLMLFRVPSVTGSQNFRLSWWDDLVGEDMSGLGNTRLWPLLNLRYLASAQPLELPGLEPVHEEGGPAVYRWQGPTPGAWVVHEAVTRAPVEQVSALREGEVDPFTTALLDPGVPVPSMEGAEPGSSTVRWVVRQPDLLVVDVDTPSEGILVLSEIYHPAWAATVDGEGVEVLKVDVALRGIHLDGGRHRVEMRFRDPNVTLGAWGSGVGVLLWVGLVAFTRRRQGEG